MNKALQADLLLLLVAILWGATFPLVSAALPYMHTYLLVSARFTVAAVFFLPFVFLKLKKTDKRVLIAGLVLGVLNAAVYIFQTLGMRHVDADTAAFIASVGVVFVPFFSALMGLGRVKKIEIVGCLTCVFGLYILTGADFNAFTFDEGLILVAAIAWALGVCYIQYASPRIKETDLLAFYQIVFLLPISFFLSTFNFHMPVLKPIVVFTISYTGILATVVVFVIQVRYQRNTTATHAAIIYSLEPVLASLIAIYVNHLPLTPKVIYGGGIILLSILIIEVFPQIRLKYSR